MLVRAGYFQLFSTFLSVSFILEHFLLILCDSFAVAIVVFLSNPICYESN